MFSIFLASVGHFVAWQRNNIISCFLISFERQVEYFLLTTTHSLIILYEKKQDKSGSKWDHGHWVLPGIAMRVGGSDTPWTGNWVVGGHALQTKWGG